MSTLMQHAHTALAAAFGFLSGVAAVAAASALAGTPGATVARIKPFILPVVAVAAPDIVQPNTAKDPGDKR